MYIFAFSGGGPEIIANNEGKLHSYMHPELYELLE
jgi:hypothetical protein